MTRRPSTAHLRRLLAHVRQQIDTLALTYPRPLRTEWQRLELDAFEAALPWLDRELSLEHALEQRRCPLSPTQRGHRVRVREAHLGGVMFEGCRCGAVRRVERDPSWVSDWTLPETAALLSPLKP